MRKRWIILAILLGAGVFDGTWYWPAGPLWRAEVRSYGKILGFSKDSRVLYTADGLSSGFIVGREWSDFPPRILRFDSATGNILSSYDIELGLDPLNLKVTLSPDGSTLLVGGFDPKGRNCPYFLYDALTGLQRCGPINDVDAPSRDPFSPDGRWLLAYRGPQGELPESLEVIDTATGTPVYCTQIKKNETVSECFAAEGSALALLWETQPGDEAMYHWVQIIDLPSGQERRRFKLPAKTWMRLVKWEGNRLYAQGYFADGSPSGPWRGYSFDLGVDPVGEGREEILFTDSSHGTETFSHCADGPGWAAQISVMQDHWHEKSRTDELLEWFGEKLGKDIRLSHWWYWNPSYGHLRIADPATARVRYDLPVKLTFPFAISPDGKRVANLHPSYGVEVWDAAPSRWLLPTAAGFAIAGIVLLFGRWRKRRKTRTTFIPTMPAN